MKNVFELLESTDINPQDTYLISYPYLLDFSLNKTEFTVSDFIQLSHMVYGWMPTILKVRDHKKIQKGAQLLTKAKHEGFLTEEELNLLKKIVNNSIVGVSKMLHFVNPKCFPIWDSRIYQFVYNKKAYENANNTKKYLKFIELLQNLEKEDNNQFYRTINLKLGYSVTKFRAIELIMFQNSPKF